MAAKKQTTPDEEARAQDALTVRLRVVQARNRFRTLNRSTPFQMVKTLITVMLWLGVSPLYIRLIALYEQYPSALMTVSGLAMSTGIAVHLWPTRTAPWRTVAWTAVAMMVTGMVCLPLGADTLALTFATLVGFLVAAGRVNSNARKAWRLFQDWRVLR